MSEKTYSSADIADWRPEDNAFWESTGSKVAYRNLWISIPNLLVGFAVWGMWGITTLPTSPSAPGFNPLPATAADPSRAIT